MTFPSNKDIDESVECKSWSFDDEYRTTWKTIISDGKILRHLPRLVSVFDSTPCYLDVKTRAARHKIRGRKGQISYLADQLFIQPISTAKSKRFAGGAELKLAQRSFSYAQLHPSEENFFIPDQYLLNVLSLFDNTVGIEVRHNGPGGIHPIHDAEWRTVSLKNKRTHKLQASSLNQAQRAFVEKVHNDSQQYAPYRLNFDSFILLPYGKRTEVQWALPCSQGAGRGSVVLVDFKPAPDHILQSYDNYTLSPDKTAAVLWKQGKLYWQSPPFSGKPKLIGRLGNLRGWQWLDIAKISAAQRKIFGLK